MSEDERSPKRQRRSFSPASPPAFEPKRAGRFVQDPQTPPPSVHMSPSWQSQPLQAQQAGGSGPGSVTIPTPPSTVSFAGQNVLMERPEVGAESGQQTPAAESTSEHEGKHVRESDDETEERDLKRVKMEDANTEADAGHRRTNHERQEPRETVSALSDTATLYKLSTQPIASARPHFSQNMIRLYGLTDLQASVARRDEQGNKINKLRKSYEGKVKALGLEGKPKARVNDEGPALLGLLDPAWDNQNPDGSTWWDARKAELPIDEMEHNEGIFGRLESALSMRPGRLPKEENDKWVERVGLDDSAANRAVPPPNAAKPTVLNPALARTGTVQVMRASAPASPRNLAGRPERAGRKRRYDESSYTGYQEGYEDDGYSTGGGEDTGRRRSGSKKQKRQDFGPSASSPPIKSAAGVVGV